VIALVCTHMRVRERVNTCRDTRAAHTHTHANFFILLRAGMPVTYTHYRMHARILTP
jgi:hypothetical protein